MQCWGANAEGQNDVPDGVSVEVATGDRHTCGALDSGSVICWGSSDDGRTGRPLDTYTLLSSNGDHHCAIEREGGYRGGLLGPG